LRLSLVLPVVFHTGPQPWNAHRTLAELFPGIERLQSWVPAWPILFWDITEHDPRELLDSARAWLQVLAVVRAERAERDEFRAVLTEALRRLESLSGSDAVRWKELLWFVLSWSLRRRPDEEKQDWQQSVIASQENAADQAEVRAMSEVAWKTWDEATLERGELRGLRKALQEVLEEKFGPLPDALVQRIEAATDPDRLRTAIRQVLHIQSLGELPL
jgi:hypothetical protein